MNPDGAQARRGRFARISEVRAAVLANDRRSQSIYLKDIVSSSHAR
jgi:hypothetical protein